MRILCPLCAFVREVDETKIPPRAQMATCPKCQHKFRFRVVDDLEPEEAEPSASPNVSPGVPGFGGPQQNANPQAPGPMAAQRAAAASEWERLRGGKPLDPASAPGEGDQQPRVTLEQPQPREPLVGPDSPAGDPADNQAQAGQLPDSTPPANDVEIPTPYAARAEVSSTGSFVPFEDLPRHGFFGGLWATILLILKTPAPFFRSMPVIGGMAKPLIFHLLLAEFMVFWQFAWGMTGMGSVSQYSGNAELMDMSVSLAGAGSFMVLVVYPLLLVMRLMVMTGVIHLLLKVLRAGRGGPEATFRVLCYSAAPLVIGFVPFLGPIVGGVWSLVLTVIGLKEAHRTNYSSALFGVLVPIMLLLAAMLGLVQSGAFTLQ